MNWWLYGLVFVFGYITCKTFYFFNSMRLGITALKASQIIYLSTMVKALENLSYSKEIMLEHMLKAEKKSAEISAFQYRFEQEEKLLKDRSILIVKSYYKGLFKEVIEFDDWKTAMEFLMQNKSHALDFWRNHD
tara:strand:+ start:540 stop:941 length:402 start_codon:yes stop_codon:yes gene_type:complete